MPHSGIAGRIIGPLRCYSLLKRRLERSMSCHPHRPNALPRLTDLVIGLALLVLGAVPTLAQSADVLDSIRKVRELPAERAALEQPIRLRGVVTAISGWKSSFFFQDSTSGISVDPVGPVPGLQAGELVEVSGVTLPGKFAPVIQATTVKVLGTAAMPLSRGVGLAELSGGTLDGQWTTISGVVHRAEVKPLWGHDTLILSLDIGGGTLVTVRVRSFSKDSWRTLPTSVVSLQGVCGTVFNDKRQFIALRFFVSSLDDVKILRPGPKDPFDRPLMEIGAIGRFRPADNQLNLVRIRGVVTYLSSDGKAYVQSNSGSVLVDMNQEGSVTRGSTIEVVGYPRDGDYAPSLEGAAFRPVSSTSEAIKAIPVNARDVITERDGFLSSPYDSTMVQVHGVLRQIIHSAEDSVLFLDDGGTVFTARLPKPSNAHQLPAVGSVVTLTGICQTRVDKAHDPQSFRLLLRTPADIQVMTAAPWWSAEHAKTVVAAMTIALAVMALILVLYRREAGLRHLSLTDPLTGLHNRRGFMTAAEQRWRLALRHKTSIVLFYIDLDRFKEINDSLGHKQGDVALQAVADILRACFRKSDVVGRLGGDEFAVVVWDADARSQEELGERLAALVSRSNRHHGRSFKLSLSVGTLLCDASMSALTLEDLVARTDALMYEKKLASRRLPDPARRDRSQSAFIQTTASVSTVMSSS